MAKIIVSACLLGLECRYDGRQKPNDKVIALGKKHCLIPVCPEQMGGLSTPRDASERVGNKVVSCMGKDVTSQYNRGAKMALQVAKVNGATVAILKAKSPSCGKGCIYDGTFRRQLTQANGVTVDLFLENGIAVYTEGELENINENDQA